MHLTKINDNHWILRKGNIKIILTATEIDKIWRIAESNKKKKLK